MEKKNIVRSDNHITIDGWMLNELGLSGAELIIYAVIYGFSQADDTWCTASQAYIAAWAGVSTRAMISAVNRLEEKGYVIRVKSTCKKGFQCVYKAVRPSQNETESDVKKLHIRCEETSYPDVKKLHIRCEETSHNNIEDNIDNNIEDIKENIIKENSESETDSVPESDTPKKKRNNFVKPTIEEVRTYCKEINSIINPDCFYDHYESNGWKVGKVSMKDWKSTLRNWERRERKQTTINQKTCGDNKSQEFMDFEPF